MDANVLTEAIMAITKELDKLSAYAHKTPEEQPEEPMPEEGMGGLEGLMGEGEGEESEEEEPEEMPEEGMNGKKPMKIDYLSIKKGKKGAFA